MPKKCFVILLYRSFHLFYFRYQKNLPKLTTSGNKTSKPEALDKPLSDTQTYTLMQNNNAFPRNSTPDTNSKSKPKAVTKEYRLLRLR